MGFRKGAVRLIVVVAAIATVGLIGACREKVIVPPHLRGDVMASGDSLPGDARAGDARTGDALLGECNSELDCTRPGPCEQSENARCVNHACVYAPTSGGLDCDDANPCTLSDQCDGQGRCTGQSVTCESPPGDECVSGDTAHRTYATIGTCRTSDGQCDYPHTDTPCPDCASSCLGMCDGVQCPNENGGCMTNGTCVFTPGSGTSCEHTPASDGASCDFNGDTTPGDGVCLGGACVECYEDDHCPGLCDGCNVSNNTCGAAVDDDSNCGIIDCPTDTRCRDWDPDITSNRCASVGVCKDTAFCGHSDYGPSRTCGSPATDDCDAQDTCDGAGTCADRLVAGGTVCRADSGACDVAETCTGSSKACPANGFEPPGTSCGSAVSTACDAADTCNSNGQCIDRVDGLGTVCNSSANPCKTDATCDGSTKNCPPLGNASSSTSCGDQTPDGPCDLADRCDGAGTCTDRVRSSSYLCDSGDICHGPSYCVGAAGSYSCPSNPPLTGNLCLAANGVCDVNDYCDNGSCPATYEPSSTECAAETACVQAANCPGNATTCPTPADKASGTACGTSGKCDSGTCYECNSGAACAWRTFGGSGEICDRDDFGGPNWGWRTREPGASTDNGTNQVQKKASFFGQASTTTYQEWGCCDSANDCILGDETAGPDDPCRDSGSTHWSLPAPADDWLCVNSVWHQCIGGRECGQYSGNTCIKQDDTDLLQWETTTGETGINLIQKQECLPGDFTGDSCSTVTVRAGPPTSDGGWACCNGSLACVVNGPNNTCQGQGPRVQSPAYLCKAKIWFVCGAASDGEVVRVGGTDYVCCTDTWEAVACP